jgi:hypothetical protein
MVMIVIFLPTSSITAFNMISFSYDYLHIPHIFFNHLDIGVFAPVKIVMMGFLDKLFRTGIAIV